MGRLYALALTALLLRQAPPKPADSPGSPACKLFGGPRCCDPQVAAHLPKAAVFKTCGKSETVFLGEQGAKDTCKYFFQAEGAKPGDAYVQIYAPPAKQVPPTPNDPFFSWKKIGKVFLADRAKSPKAAAMTSGATGLWMPGEGYFVSVSASTKVCTKKEATRLAAAMK